MNHFNEVIGFHQKMITRARMWAIISSVAGALGICIGIFILEGEDNLAKSITTISGVAITGLGLAWPLREIYNVRNRVEAVKMFQKRYIGPPEANEEEKLKIKTKIDEIINRSL